jgi:hypothetical protein
VLHTLTERPATVDDFLAKASHPLAGPTLFEGERYPDLQAAAYVQYMAGLRTLVLAMSRNHSGGYPAARALVVGIAGMLPEPTTVTIPVVSGFATTADGETTASLVEDLPEALR